MAELPTLGKNCSWSDCNDLDFLPIVCHFCKENFCKKHFLPEQHSCPSRVDIQVPDASTGKADVRYTCHLDTCKKWELAPVTCSFCSKQVCLNHRFQDAHSCNSLVKPQPAMANTKAHVQQIINTNPSQTTSVKKPKSLAAKKTAAKVQLMKLKMKCVGEMSLPDQERVHLLVHPPKESKGEAKGCFVSSRWSVGRVVDSLAELTKTKNNNNVTGAPKLRLFRSEGDLVSERMDTPLADLLASDRLLNGDTVYLEYATDTQTHVQM